ncbi:replication protein A 70 kDa DNA-binding subunit B [Tanacetum coccineum]
MNHNPAKAAAFDEIESFDDLESVGAGKIREKRLKVKNMTIGDNIVFIQRISNGKCIESETTTATAANRTIGDNIVFIQRISNGKCIESETTTATAATVTIQGTKIHATVNSSIVCDFDTLLKENDYQIITNFNVKRNVDSTKLTKHEFKIQFYKKTNVRNCSEFSCNDDGMNFISFKDFVEGKIDQSYSFDVIGRLIQNKDITVLNPNNAPKHILEFQLQDVMGTIIPCILWNDLAIKLHQYIKDHECSTEPIIVLIKMARLSIWNRVTQVSNCFAGSKLLISEDNPHIKAFKDIFETTNLSSNEKTKVELSSNTIVRKPEDYYSQFPLKSIDELYELSEPIGCVVIGKVLKIVNDQGWYYTICSNCNSVVKPLDAQQRDKSYNCENCKKNADVYPRIKIQIRVQDDSGSASFCLFQTEVAKLLGKSVAYLISKIDKGEQITSYPQDLDSIVNRVFVFKLQVSTYNVNNNYHIFTVDKITDDKEVIKSILAKQTKEEESESDTLEKESAEGKNKKSAEKEACETSASGGIKRKNLGPEKSVIEKKAKVEHEDTKDETGFYRTNSYVHIALTGRDILARAKNGTGITVLEYLTDMCSIQIFQCTPNKKGRATSDVTQVSGVGMLV